MQDRKNQILNLSADLLRSKGFENFSYKDLSDALGIAKASIHHHYPKKADLANALCDWSSNWLARAFDAIDQEHQNAWDKLVAFHSGALSCICKENKVCPLAALHQSLPFFERETREKIKALDKQELDWLSKVIAEGQASGEFSERAQAQDLALLYISSCKGSLYYARLHGAQVFDTTMAQLALTLKK